jgi:hypothetical protein
MLPVQPVQLLFTANFLKPQQLSPDFIKFDSAIYTII